MDKQVKKVENTKKFLCRNRLIIITLLILCSVSILRGSLSAYTVTGSCRGLSTGCDQTCVLKSDGNVDCYGWNAFGQAEDYMGTDAIGVFGGVAFNCVLRSNGNVHCYGQISDDYEGGDAVGVATGEGHICILKADGNVDCYGNNTTGQVVNYEGADAVGVAAGDWHTCILKSNGNVDCHGWNYYGESEDYTGGDATGVAAGGAHTCILKLNGNVDCRGWNGSGESEDYTGGDAIGVAVGGSHTCILKSDGNVDCYGDNYYGQAEDYEFGNAIGVAAGCGHTCILKSDGNVHCYGWSISGQAEDYTGGDAVCGSIDQCPDDPNKTGPGVCGCGVSDTDTDGDGTMDCNDGCPNDPNKTESGICGCGAADTDLDSDTIADCFDNCPTTPNTDQTDSDGNGIGDVCEVGYTPAGSHIVVNPLPEVTITFSGVIGGGLTTITKSSTGQSIPTQYMVGNPPIYYDINTAAQYTPPVTVCIDYTGVAYDNVNQLKLMHWDGECWVNITDPGYPDAVKNIICGTTNSLSPFVVVELVDNDGDGYKSDVDCDDSDPNVHPEAAEICDAKDNNCDGSVDEDLGTTTCGVGACQITVDNCVNGVVQTCTPLPPTAEVCDTEDNDCNGSVDENYVFRGFQQPINSDSSSIFKTGSVIPVKVVITNCSGQSISTATVTIAVNRISNAITGTELEMDVALSGSANTGNLFRYDPIAGQYIFNLSTKGYTAGTYKVTAKLNDGKSYSVNFSLKK